MAERALVTGGSRNIGRAICERLVEDGYEVIQFDLVEPENPEAGRFVEVDLGDEALTAEALSALVAEGPVTRLVNNVGIFHAAGIDKIDLADFDRVIRINTRTAIQCTQALVPGMREARFGRIVSIASRAAQGMAKVTAYGASKAAIATMARSWALELGADGITSNSIAPGPIDTVMLRAANPPGSPQHQQLMATIPVGRVGQPADIAHAASFLLDESTGFVTGQALFVCGGMSIGRLL